MLLPPQRRLRLLERHDPMLRRDREPDVHLLMRLRGPNLHDARAVGVLVLFIVSCAGGSGLQSPAGRTDVPEECRSLYRHLQTSVGAPGTGADTFGEACRTWPKTAIACMAAANDAEDIKACGHATLLPLAHPRTVPAAVGYTSAIRAGGPMHASAFDSVTHGFRFENCETDNCCGGGCCGGVAYGALDYFAAKQPVPVLSLRRGTALEPYIAERQRQTMAQNASIYTRAFWTSSSVLYTDSVHAFGTLEKIIDAGNPSPLALIATDKIPWDGHEVVATGYSKLGNVRTIYIYDPNYPGLHLSVTNHGKSDPWIETDDEDHVIAEWLATFVVPYTPRTDLPQGFDLAGVSRTNTLLEGYSALYDALDPHVYLMCADEGYLVASPADFTRLKLDATKILRVDPGDLAGINLAVNGPSSSATRPASACRRATAR